MMCFRFSLWSLHLFSTGSFPSCHPPSFGLPAFTHYLTQSKRGDSNNWIEKGEGRLVSAGSSCLAWTNSWSFPSEEFPADFSRLLSLLLGQAQRSDDGCAVTESLVYAGLTLLWEMPERKREPLTAEGCVCVHVGMRAQACVCVHLCAHCRCWGQTGL